MTNKELAKKVDELEKLVIELDQSVKNTPGSIDAVFPIKFKGVIPQRATEGSVGFDLVASKGCGLYPGRSGVIKTGTFVQIPTGYVGLIKCRSGLGFKKGAETFQGVIDNDFRGELQVKVCNNSIEMLNIKKGDRFAQLVVVPCLTVSEEVEELDETGRDKQGFGSTGR